MSLAHGINNAFFSDDTFLPSYFSMAVIYVAMFMPVLAILAAGFLIILSSFLEAADTPTGCSPLGMRKGTNFADELEAKHESGSMDESTWRVKSIMVYPIKSCRGVELARSPVVGTGLQYDRQFSFARLLPAKSGGTATGAEEPWRFITQREFRLLTQVRVEMWVPDPKRPAYRPDLPYVLTGGALVVSFPWTEPGWRGRMAALAARLLGGGGPPRRSFIVPFEPTPDQLRRDYSTDRFTIWNETVTATNMGLHVPPELRRFLSCSQPLTLMRVHTPREVFRNAPTKATIGWQPTTGFADAYPIHVMGFASVRDVSRRQPETAPVLSPRRFRANVYLEGTPPFKEDEWRKIKIGTWTYHIVSRCVRCTIPNIEPDSGVRHMSQPRKTLLAYRDVDKGAPGDGCLGMNMCPEAPQGEIKVGDPIKVLETGEHFYIKM